MEQQHKMELSGKRPEIKSTLSGDNIGLRKDDPDLRGSDAKTGSLIATGLATGLAALIIHCVRLGALYHQHSQVNMTGRVTVREFQKIQEHEYIAFEHIAGRGKPDRNYIRIRVESFTKSPLRSLPNHPKIATYCGKRSQRWLGSLL